MKQSISALLLIYAIYFASVTLVEFFNSAASSNITLTSSEERMTFRTYVDMQFFFYRSQS